MVSQEALLGAADESEAAAVITKKYSSRRFRLILCLFGATSLLARGLLSLSKDGGAGESWEASSHAKPVQDQNLFTDVYLAWHRWTAFSVPSPQKQPSACGLSQPGDVCDPDRLLESSSRIEIQGIIDTINSQTDFVFSVLVVQDVEGPCTAPHCPQRQSVLKEFARGVLQEWGIGNGDEGPGVLLVVSWGMRSAFIRTEVDAGNRNRGLLGQVPDARHLLPDSTCKIIASRDMASYFQKGFKDEGIKAGVRNISLYLKGEKHADTSFSADDKACVKACVVFILVCIVLLLFVYTDDCGRGEDIRRGGGYSRRGGGSNQRDDTDSGLPWI